MNDKCSIFQWSILFQISQPRPNMMTTGTVSAIIEAIVTHADWFFPGGKNFSFFFFPFVLLSLFLSFKACQF